MHSPPERTHPFINERLSLIVGGGDNTVVSSTTYAQTSGLSSENPLQLRRYFNTFLPLHPMLSAHGLTGGRKIPNQLRPRDCKLRHRVRICHTHHSCIELEHRVFLGCIAFP